MYPLRRCAAQGGSKLPIGCGGCAPPRPCGYFSGAGKVTKSALEPTVLGLPNSELPAAGPRRGIANIGWR